MLEAQDLDWRWAAKRLNAVVLAATVDLLLCWLGARVGGRLVRAAGIERRAGIITGLSVVLVTLFASAQAAKIVHKQGLRGEVGAGFSSASGLALTSSVNSNDRVRDRVGLWDYGGGLSYNYFSYNNVVGANRLVVKLQARRTLRHAPVGFLVASVRYDHNLFDGYDYYVTEMLNAGQNVLHTPSMHLDLEAGGGARQNTYPDSRSAIDEPAADLAMKYVWHIQRGTRFSQTLTVIGARTGSLMTANTSVSTTLVYHLALKFSEEVVHYTSLPYTALMHYAKTTTFTTLNLIYRVG